MAHGKTHKDLDLVTLRQNKISEEIIFFLKKDNKIYFNLFLPNYQSVSNKHSVHGQSFCL